MISKNIPEAVRAAGVIGAGGAGFPTYVKLQSEVEHVIANGAECEPLLAKDRESMIQEQDAFFKGLAAMREATKASTVTVCVKEKNKDVTEHVAVRDIENVPKTHLQAISGPENGRWTPSASDEMKSQK